MLGLTGVSSILKLIFSLLIPDTTSVLMMEPISSFKLPDPRPLMAIYIFE